MRLTEETIAEDDENERHGVRGDAWFGSIKTASELAIRGFEYMLQVKQYHALCPKDFIEEALKDTPGGVTILYFGRHGTQQSSTHCNWVSLLTKNCSPLHPNQKRWFHC